MERVKKEELATEIRCEQCDARMIIRWGKNGAFLACPNYPRCRNTKNFTRTPEGEIQVVNDQHEETHEICEKCGAPMQVRWGKYGKFLGCSTYPKCRNIKSLVETRPIGMKCPQCEAGNVIEKTSRRGKVFFGCDRYPECTFASWDRPVPEACPECGSRYLVEKVSKRTGVRKICPDKECSYRDAVEELDS
jgi:DNA topoisomerase-1